MGQYKFKRVLLKLSGEALMGSQDYGIDTNMTTRIATEIAEAHAKGLQIALVIGAGNIFRGLSAQAGGIERSSADYMGMLATVMNALEGRVVIFAAGTGNPYFTTDTAAALRAAEMNCEALLKGTQVDGVYSADPKKDPNATRYDTLSYQTVLAEDLKVMDSSAVSLMRENNIPIIVFSLHAKGGFDAVMQGKGTSTIITA